MTTAKRDDPSIDALAITEAPAITGVHAMTGKPASSGSEILAGQILAGRFSILKRLGSGGMGVVFEALDRETGGQVALKLLPVLEPQALLRFKNEFRLLRDIQHPNSIRLSELVEERGRWFFTMERIDGVDFLTYVRVGSSVDEERLTAALRQLVSALEAVHAAGLVHRDVKPSNILVTRQGRLVLLDFGVVMELNSGDRFTEAGKVVGTVAYMAPEQALSGSVGPAADWYSVGVLLYEALAGRVPFRGAPFEVLLRKQQSAPPPPRSWDPGAGESFAGLCLELLHPDPQQRPSGQEILARLGSARAAPPSTARAQPRPAQAAPFVGRRLELEALQTSFESVRGGNAVSVLVRGESGVGKSALLRHFADRLREHDADAVVLTGRCYERESVPYRALDGVVDSLSQLAARLPPGEAEVLVPANAALLGEVFPVLLRVPAFAQAPVPRHKVIDPREQRIRVFSALRELFFRLAERRPTVLAIDDLQWSDADSLALLREILRPPEAPALLLVATVRPPAPAFALPGEVREVPLGQLLPGEASELAATLLGDDPARSAATIGEEARGHPLFIQMLARHDGAPGPAPGPALQLDDAIRTRVAACEPLARRLVEVVAVAGTPIPIEAAARASDLDLAELDRLASLLAAANLLRTSGARAQDVIEPYHDRVREAVAARLDPAERKRLHQRLARAIPATEKHFETLASHWRAADEPAQAADYAVLAADAATRALAFERSARLYRWALELAPSLPHATPELHAKLGSALANAGRGAEAAEAFDAAARVAQAASAGPLQVLDLRRRAAEELLRSGRFDRGLEALRSVLRATGIRVAHALSLVLFSVLCRRALVRLRGIRFVERDAAAANAEQLARADACWAGAMGLGLSDFIRGMELQTRHFLLALRAGEPYRVARALAFETCYTASYGVPTRRRTAKLLEATRRLATRLDEPHALAWVPFAEGVSAWLEGRFKNGLHACDEAEHSLRDRCTGVTWELASIQLFAHWCLWALGEYGELARRVAVHLREAEERGDSFAVSTLRTGLANVVWLASDQPARALEETERAISGWSRQGFHLQHLWDMLARAETGLYVGEAGAAHAELMQRWPALARSLLLRPQINRGISFSLRGRCALAAAARASGKERARLIRDVEHCARRLEQERVPYTVALAGLLRAGLAASLDRARSAELYERAALALDAADMSLHASVARRRRAELLGGSGSAEQIAAADELARSRGIARPERIAALLAPIALLEH